MRQTTKPIVGRPSRLRHAGIQRTAGLVCFSFEEGKEMRRRYIIPFFVVAAFLAWGVAVPALAAPVTHISIVGAGKGAGAFRLAAGLAEAVNQTSKTVQVTNRESGGFVANMRHVGNGKVDLGLTSAVFIDFWQRRKRPFDRDKGDPGRIRGVGPVSRSVWQMAVLKSSSIMTFHDLKGKRINMGPRGSNTLFMSRVSLETLGIIDTVRKDYLKWTDAATNLVDKKLDAFGIPNPMPSPSILQASRMAPLRILDVPDEITKKFIGMSPGYTRDLVDASLYQGMEGKKFKTLGYTMYAVAHDKVPNDVVYEVARATYATKNYQFLINVMKGWKIGLDMQKKSGKFLAESKPFNMKWHPGAMRYWKERGYAN